MRDTDPMPEKPSTPASIGRAFDQIRAELSRAGENAGARIAEFVRATLRDNRS